MKTQKKSQLGITLIALVISIIVMLILAGVSLNEIIGENGIITNAKKSIVSTNFAKYKEELEFSIIGLSSEEKQNIRITAFHSDIQKYIPSMEDDQIENFAIIDNELYYFGDDKSSREVAIFQIFMLLRIILQRKNI